MVLFFTPVVLPVTVKLKSQLPPTETVALVNAIVLVAAVAVKLFTPPQTDEVESAIDNPAGNTSVNATPVNDVDRFGFVIEKLKLVELLVST